MRIRSMMVLVCVAITAGGCHKGAASAGGASPDASVPSTAPAAPPVAAGAGLPRECQALIASLQGCSDRLTAAKSPIAAQMQRAVQDMRNTMPAAAGDPTLGPSCGEKLKAQEATNKSLGC